MQSTTWNQNQNQMNLNQNMMNNIPNYSDSSLQQRGISYNNIPKQDCNNNKDYKCCDYIKSHNITTYLELSSFSELSIEKYLYMGNRTLTKFAKTIIKSSWFTTSIKQLYADKYDDKCDNKCDKNNNYHFDLTPTKKSDEHFLLYTYLRFVLPKIKLKNITSQTQKVNENGELLFYTKLNEPIDIKDTTLEIGEIVVGTSSSLLNLGISESNIIPLISNVPKQRARYSKNLAHNILKCAKFKINNNTLETLNSNILDDIRQHRLREGQRPAYEKMIGNHKCDKFYYNKVVNNGNNEYNSFIPCKELKLPLPFSFMRSALIDKGACGSYTTALPLLKLFKNNVSIDVELQDDLTDYIIFQREKHYVIDKLPGDDNDYVNYLSVSDSELTVDNISVTDLNIIDIIPDQYEDLCRRPKNTKNHNNDNYNYQHINNFVDIDCIKSIPSPELYYNYSTVTEYEYEKFTNNRCSTLLCERYISFNKFNIKPSDVVCFELNVSGQTRNITFKANNSTSSLLGRHSNYTNDSSEYEYGENSLNRAKLVYGDKDEKFDLPIGHFDTIEPFFHCQSTTYETGYNIYNKNLWINSLNPDGSINLHNTTCPKLYLNTTPSNFNYDLCHSVVENTNCYDVIVNVLTWQIYNINFNCFDHCN
jgi:hypothetical protein